MVRSGRTSEGVTVSTTWHVVAECEYQTTETKEDSGEFTVTNLG